MQQMFMTSFTKTRFFPKSGRMLDVGTGEGLLPYTHEKMGENGGPKWDTYAIET
jgi:hypothetical protein